MELNVQERILLLHMQARDQAPMTCGSAAQRSAMASLLEKGLVFKGRAGWYTTKEGDAIDARDKEAKRLWPMEGGS